MTMPADDGRENAVDEDDLNSDEEDDFSGESSSLGSVEAETIGWRLVHLGGIVGAQASRCAVIRADL